MTIPIRPESSARELWLPELRESFAKETAAEDLVLRLRRGEGEERDFVLRLPVPADGEDREFLVRYLTANVYNILSVYSGRELYLFCPPGLREIAGAVPTLFEKQPGLNKTLRIARRIFGGFSFRLLPLSDWERAGEPATARTEGLDRQLRELCRGAETSACIGVDVGGSDIKTAASVDGKLVYTEEYDWNPQQMRTAEEILAPILAAVRRAAGHMEPTGRRPDAVGLSFPDIVINDTILGGETPKTKGLRENPALDYECEFARFRDLRERLLAYCGPGGRVRIVNDGNMAAFTAAVELAAGGGELRKGILAHSLGTDLGTGWFPADGRIPNLPLELYDLLLDLGNSAGTALPPEDLRSTRNENSGLPGLRRYLGQAAVYRLAWQRSPRLLEGFVRREGELLAVPTEPEDLRKPCLEHIMSLAARGDPAAGEVFREIGRNLAMVCAEAEWLLGKTPPERFLFGRFVKSEACFALLCQGFTERSADLRLRAADENLANTPLMRQLAETPGVTVAQFGQAVGAIYYALYPN